MSGYLLILGCSGLAREIGMMAEEISRFNGGTWDEIGFISDSEDNVGDALEAGMVVGTDEWLLKNSFKAQLVVGIGHPKIKAKVVDKYLAVENRFTWPNLIHPSLKFDTRFVRMGMGNVICAGNLMTCGIKIRDFNLFNLNTTIGHDATIGSYNVFNPSSSISGFVNIGDRVLCGVGSQVLEKLTVGDDATVGAGALVTKNVPSGVTVVGVPAKPMKRSSNDSSKPAMDNKP